MRSLFIYIYIDLKLWLVKFIKLKLEYIHISFHLNKRNITTRNCILESEIV